MKLRLGYVSNSSSSSFLCAYSSTGMSASITVNKAPFTVRQLFELLGQGGWINTTRTSIEQTTRNKDLKGLLDHITGAPDKYNDTVYFKVDMDDDRLIKLVNLFIEAGLLFLIDKSD